MVGTIPPAAVLVLWVNTEVGHVISTVMVVVVMERVTTESMERAVFVRMVGLVNYVAHPPRLGSLSELQAGVRVKFLCHANPLGAQII